ncbi:hypothetical protein IK5_06154 [Bacillus cereus VD154]|uniref:Uncharacterized protein n=1 Tax=Bacillus cereus VD154 TaxID=1053238 RepID=A0A9W5NZ57_BACCE|nr:hypothetical protein IK5_06154 [Bacillus cereus VD154]
MASSLSLFPKNHTLSFVLFGMLNLKTCPFFEEITYFIDNKLIVLIILHVFLIFCIEKVEVIF